MPSLFNKDPPKVAELQLTARKAHIPQNVVRAGAAAHGQQPLHHASNVRSQTLMISQLVRAGAAARGQAADHASNAHPEQHCARKSPLHVARQMTTPATHNPKVIHLFF